MLYKIKKEHNCWQQLCSKEISLSDGISTTLYSMDKK